MTTLDAPPSLSETLNQLRSAWPGGGWEWDGRFGCALSAVSQAHEPAARQALAAALPSVFTPARLGDAPEPIQRLCAEVGGLRGDQLVYAAPLKGGSLAFCLWWPWGGGKNFSARVGAISGGEQDLDPEVRAALAIP